MRWVMGRDVRVGGELRPGQGAWGRTLGLLVASLAMGAPAWAQDSRAPVSGRPAASAAPRSAKNYEPTVRLLTHDGQAVRFYDDLIKGRVALINTMFTSCQAICPPITANLAKVQRGLQPYLGKQVVMVSISVDPETDTPAVLKRYAGRFGVGPGWIFLTGKRADIDAVLAKIGDGDPDKNRHSGMLLLGDDAARSWRKLPAMADADQIVAAVEKLLASRDAGSAGPNPGPAPGPAGR